MWNGDAADVMKGQEFKKAIEELDVQFTLCISDRPFNVMTDKAGTLLPWDRMTGTEATHIAEQEAKFSDPKKGCFISRVSQRTMQHWRKAYETANLHEQVLLMTLRTPSSVNMGCQTRFR